MIIVSKREIMSSVAQYIKYECNKKTVYFLHRFAFYFLTKIEGREDRKGDSLKYKKAKTAIVSKN